MRACSIETGVPMPAPRPFNSPVERSKTVTLCPARLSSIAAAHPEIGVDLVRRLMWALNDESATNGLYGIPALAEIGFNDPELIRAFVAPLASLAWDDGLRLEILRSLARIAEAAPELVAPAVEQVKDHVDPEDLNEVHALNRLRDVSGGIHGS